MIRHAHLFSSFVEFFLFVLPVYIFCVSFFVAVDLLVTSFVS